MTDSVKNMKYVLFWIYKAKNKAAVGDKLPLMNITLKSITNIIGKPTTIDIQCVTQISTRHNSNKEKRVPMVLYIC